LFRAAEVARPAAPPARPGPAPGAEYLECRLAVGPGREQQGMRIEGKCHCGNIRYALNWPDDGSAIGLRACGCSFCTKHGGSWTSHRGAELIAEVRDASLLSRYRQGTETADFYVCARCGAVPFVTSAVEGRLYAVVNGNTLEGIDLSALSRKPMNFDGEGVGERLERRKRYWIGNVRVAGA
jgi:hypothetical protein